MLTQLRQLWRAARSLPVLHTVLSSADRLWWARTIREADIVDRELVSGQLGRAVTERQAVREYVRGGFRSGLTLNPLFSERLVSTQLPDSDRVPAMYAYLVADQAEIQTSLAWDAPAYAQMDSTAPNGQGGVLGSGWRRLRSGGEVQLRGGGYADLARLHTAAHLPRAAALNPPVAQTVLVWTLDGADADGEGLRDVLAVLDDDVQGLHFELVLDVAHAPRDVAMLAGQLSLGNTRICLLGAADAVNRASESNCVIIRRAPRSLVTAETIRRLADAARLGPVAPLWIAPDGTIASAGVLTHLGRHYRALQGFPKEDASRAEAELCVAALDSPVVAVIVNDNRPPRTLLHETVVGDAPPEAFPPVIRGVPDLPTAPRGLQCAGWETTESGAVTPRYLRTSEVTHMSGGTTVPRLRWAIKTAAPAGRHGESWGETHFARSLAAALERLGQYVAVDARPALNRPSSALDDVVLCLRGPHPLPAPEAAHRMLWIISHPEEITAAEVAGYDYVFAGSPSWARVATERFGMPIEPLLQCTDATRFRPSGIARRDELVFVGTARGIARPAVVVPLRAGRPVRVYGPDWRGYIPGSAIAATHLPNEEVPAIYESAGAVLNDHWPAMRREGFISNRLYDVVAAGGRAISDFVEGIDEMFGGAVRTFRNHQELLDLTEAPLDRDFAPDPEIARVAARIRAEHSFDARAAHLLGAVLARGGETPTVAV